jgi:hypothetical protein
VGETGPYEVRATIGGAVAGGAGSGGAGSGGVTPSPTPVGGSLLDAQGRLEAGDYVLDGGEFADAFEVGLVAGRAVTFGLASTDFDAYLVVIDPAGAVVLEVDDSAGQGLDVLESFVPETSGDYLIAVTSAFADESGAYALTVREGALAGAAVVAPTPVAPSASDGPRATEGLGTATGVVGPLALGAQVRSALAGGGDLLAYHTYFVEVPAGTAQFTVEMAADVDLDLFLKHGGEIASLAEDGDWDYRDIDVANRATFTIQAPAPGLWYIDVVWVAGRPTPARATRCGRVDRGTVSPAR